ncbi:Putative uncharacterized protein [Moritella viscosa]|uniref:hypothetical protein n=1 Tax=Moritella viscosa TaxID=80854 RepID=UPI0005091BE1|nr:hypothetical protein [Moritella viscosa]CED59226.1 putative uncharacterized phage protein [Moritella viscosa]SHO00539.1 Putative uncharacterized protein [Moritella viscosa]SHO20304.1 Putative uncharacterized protein [Moritella viscosa]
MGKKISGNVGPVIGISSSLELFEKLKYESARLESGWHPYDAFNFLVTAWHLFEDWTKSDEPRALCRQKRHRNKLPPQMSLVLDVVRDVVNGSKHYQLDPNSVNKRRVDEVHTGREVGFYEYFFHEDIPAVTVDKFWYFSVRTLNNLVMRYFEWVFDDLTAVKKFPKELIDDISYCNIAERTNVESPAMQKGMETVLNINNVQ